MKAAASLLFAAGVALVVLGLARIVARIAFDYQLLPKHPAFSVLILAGAALIAAGGAFERNTRR